MITVKFICKFLSLSCVLLLIFILSGCFHFQNTIIIEKGFSDTLVDRLQEDYHLAIPDTAKFLEGKIVQSFRDPSLYITFTIPKNDFNDMLGSDWELSYDYEDENDSSIAKHAYHLINSKKIATFVAEVTEGDSVYKVSFDGESPNSRGIK
jgi:hypothetical protein